MTLQLAETPKDLEYVKREFRRMRDDLKDELDDVHEALDDHFGDDGDLPSSLEKYLGDEGELRSHLDEAFGENGEFVDRLDEEFGEEDSRIQEALDPDTDGSPLGDLKDDIAELRALINQEKGAESVIEQSTLKDGEFEDTVSDILSAISTQTSDSYDFTGEQTGEVPDAKVGDFVYELGGTSKRVVVGAKTESYSFDGIQSEMERAIENRDADYGVFVTDHLGNIPRTKLGWFHEVDRDFFTVALSEEAESDLEPAFLRFAMNWAQVRARHDVDDASEELDTARIRSEAEAIDEKMSRFQQVRTRCTTIEDAVDDIRGELEEIENEVDRRVAELNAELTAAE
jgi:hypothetical protein